MEIANMEDMQRYVEEFLDCSTEETFEDLDLEVAEDAPSQ